MYILDIKLKNNLNSEKAFDQFVNVQKIDDLQIDRIIYGNASNPKTVNENNLDYFVEWLSEIEKEKSNFTITYNIDLQEYLLSKIFNYENQNIKIIDLKDVFHKLSFTFFEEKNMYSFFQIPEYEDSKLSSLYLTLSDLINEIDKSIISLNYRIPFENNQIEYLPLKNNLYLMKKKLDDYSLAEMSLFFKKNSSKVFDFQDGYNINNVRYMIVYFLLVQNNIVKDYDFLNTEDEKKFNKKINELLKTNIYNIKKENLDAFKSFFNVFFNSKDKLVDTKEIRQQIIDFTSNIVFDDLEF